MYVHIVINNIERKGMQVTDEKPCGCQDKKLEKRPCDCGGKCGPSGSRSTESLDARKERLEIERKEVIEQLEN